MPTNPDERQQRVDEIRSQPLLGPNNEYYLATKKNVYWLCDEVTDLAKRQEALTLALDESQAMVTDLQQRLEAAQKGERQLNEEIAYWRNPETRETLKQAAGEAKLWAQLTQARQLLEHGRVITDELSRVAWRLEVSQFLTPPTPDVTEEKVG